MTTRKATPVECRAGVKVLRFVRRVFVLLLLVVVVAGGVGVWMLRPYGPSAETFVDIAPGTGTPGIAAQLERTGIIRSRYAFEAVRWLKRGPLKAGEYRFDHPATVSDVYARLQKGDVYTRTLLVPEGYNIFDVAQAVQAAGLGTREEFLRAEQKHAALIAKWSPGATSLEGYLFPDTYKFSRHATALTMLSTMVKRFGQEAVALGLRDADVARTVTMASMVEKEVRVEGERATVAGVFENRLAAGMPLQTDPTVVYASLLQGTWTGVIHQSELHSDSAYNTYAHAGLPPGPICNPGVAALKAAMHPAKTGYMYFVADANGGSRFSTSLQEHAGNVKKYREQETGNRK